MHEITIAGPAAVRGSVRLLTAGELPQLREHLLRLSPESRHDRFNGYTDDHFIARYAAKCVSDGTVIVACIQDGVVRGAAELHRPDAANPLPEIAFSVEAQVRRQGVGSILFTQLIAKAKSLGYQSLRITTGSQNEAMRALAHKFGAKLSFARGESSGVIDLMQHPPILDKTATVTVPSMLTPLEAAHAVMNFNRACWTMFFRISGFGRAA
jgi:RimJ/RimL family protein N-acetyltransferase